MLQSRTTVVPPAPREGKQSSQFSAALGDLPYRASRTNSRALTRVVAQQLAKPPDGKEVTHERS